MYEITTYERVRILNPIKIKIWHNSKAGLIQKITETILSKHRGYQSPLIPSEKGGWHCFVTVEVSEE